MTNVPPAVGMCPPGPIGSGSLPPSRSPPSSGSALGRSVGSPAKPWLPCGTEHAECMKRRAGGRAGKVDKKKFNPKAVILAVDASERASEPADAFAFVCPGTVKGRGLSPVPSRSSMRPSSLRPSKPSRKQASRQSSWQTGKLGSTT